jgi:hypothetical protein
VTALRQSVRQPVQLHGIAAEAVRWVEGGQVQKTQGTAHFSDTFNVPAVIPSVARNLTLRPGGSEINAAYQVRG